MKAPTRDITRSIRAFFSEWGFPRRAFLGMAGALSLGAALATLSTPDSAGAFESVPPPTSFTTLLGLCTPGAAITTYTPGIQNTPRSIHLDSTITFSPCAVAQNKVVTHYEYHYDMTASCTQITDFSGGGTIFYTSGQSSDWTIDSWTITLLLGQVVGVASGTVTHGPFNGARVWSFFLRAVNDPALCASDSGVTSSTGTNTLIIAE